jgi:hypothetical protein
LAPCRSRALWTLWHAAPGARPTSFEPRAATSRSSAPRRVGSPSAWARRWHSKISGPNTNAPPSMAGSGNSPTSAVASLDAKSSESAPAVKTISAQSTTNRRSPSTAGAAAASERPFPACQSSSHAIWTASGSVGDARLAAVATESAPRPTTTTTRSMPSARAIRTARSTRGIPPARSNILEGLPVTAGGWGPSFAARITATFGGPSETSGERPWGPPGRGSITSGRSGPRRRRFVRSGPPGPPPRRPTPAGTPPAPPSDGPGRPRR